MFGALIAATDPVSVIATFKEAGVTGRLRLLVEAESPLNDGTAAVLFVVALGIAAASSDHVLHIGASLILIIGGGVLCGVLTAFVLMFLAGRTSDLSDRNYVYHPGGVRLIPSGGAFPFFRRARGTRGRAGCRQLRTARIQFKSRRCGGRVFLGLFGFRGQFFDLPADRYEHDAAAFGDL